MKRALITSAAILFASTTHAQTKQADCERDAEAKLNEMWSLAAVAGTATYKKIMDRAVACMQGGKCSKPEALVRLQEMMVDEEVIAIQREKVGLMKKFASSAGPDVGACAVIPLLSPLMQEMIDLNAKQLARFEVLSSKYYPNVPKR